MATNFPTSLDDVDSLLEAQDLASSTLSTAITAAATSLVVASGASFPTTTGILRCEDELIKYVSRSSNTFSTLTRGYSGSTAAAHPGGATIALVVSEDYHNNLKDAVIAIETKMGVSAGSLKTCARIHRAVTQSIPNGAWTTVNFDTETFDVGGMATLGTNDERLTIPASNAGKYLAIAGVQFAGNGTGIRSMILIKNGATISRGVEITPHATLSVSVSAHDILDLAVADYIGVNVFQNSGGALNIGPNADAFGVFLAMHRLS